MTDTNRHLDLAMENQSVYEWSRDNGHLDFVRRATMCDQYTQGKQWAPDAAARMKLKRKPMITINQVMNTYATLAGEQLARRGDVSFRPGAGGNPDTARILDKLWIHFIQSANYNLFEQMAFLDGIVRGRGYLDLRVEFDENTEGEAVVSYRNSKDVMLYPGSFGYDPDDWKGVLLTRRVAAVDIADTYGVSVDDIMYSGDGDFSSPEFAEWDMDSFGGGQDMFYRLTEEQRKQYRLLQVLERQEWETRMAEVFVDPRTGEMREIPDNWEKDNRHERIQEAIAQFGYGVIRKKVRKIRWVTSVGNVLLHNAISPMRHLTVLPYFPFLVGGKPVGIIEHLLSPQDLLNKSISQELHIIAGIANSGWIVKRNSLANMTAQQLEEVGGRDGVVIEVNGSVGDSIQKISANAVPTGLDRLSYKAGESIREISLVNASMMGQDRADVAGKALEAKATRGVQSLGAVFASLDQMRNFAARNWLDLTQQFVSEERVFFATGATPASNTEQITVNQEQPDGSFLNDLTLGEYSVHITNVQARDSASMQQYDILMQMMREGAPIPWSRVVNTLDILDDKTALVEEIKAREGSADPSEDEKLAKKAELDKLIAEARSEASSADVKQAQAVKAQVEARKAYQGDEDAGESRKVALDMQRQAQEIAMREREAKQKVMLEQSLAEVKRELEEMKLETQRRQTDQKITAERERDALANERAMREMETREKEAALALKIKEMEMHQREREMELALDKAAQEHEMKLRQQEELHQAKLAAVKAQAAAKPTPQKSTSND